MGSSSQKIWWILIIAALLFTSLTTGALAYAWLTLAILFGVVLIIDYMFTNEKDFLYDPDYKTWKQKTAEEY